MAEIWRYGPATVGTKPSTLSGSTVFVPLQPCLQTGTLRMVYFFAAVAGSYKIVVLRQVGANWDEVYKTGSLTAAAGLNVLTYVDFGTVNLIPGDLVGMFCNVGRMAYDSNFGTSYLSKAGDTAATGNVMTYAVPGFGGQNGLFFQFGYTVNGDTAPPTNLFDENFQLSAIPWRWIHKGTAWTNYGTKATNAATGIANGLRFRFHLGNLSTWTWSTDFEFDVATSTFAMHTSNVIQSTVGSAVSVERNTGNLIVHGNHTVDTAFTTVSTHATGIAFATGTRYRLTLAKSYRTMTYTITDVNTPANTFSTSVNQEDGTALTTVGLGYGTPSLAVLVGTCSVFRSWFAVPTARPDLYVIGDSIVEGSGVNNSNLTWPRLAASELGYSLQTSSQGGASTLHATPRLSQELIPFIAPKRTINVIGTNDTVVADWVNKTEWSHNIVSGRGDPAVSGDCCFVAALPAEVADLNHEAIFNPTLRQAKWPTIDFDKVLTSPATGLSADRNAALYADTLHPNAAGHRAMADAAKAALQPTAGMIQQAQGATGIGTF